jgi:hypothetical protein
MIEKSGREYYIECDECGEQYYEKGIHNDKYTFLTEEFTQMVEGARADGWKLKIKDVLEPNLKPLALCYCCV